MQHKDLPTRKRKTSKLSIAKVFLAFFDILFSVSAVLTFVGLFLIFMSSNVKEIAKLPNIIILSIPISLIAIAYRITLIDWFKINQRTPQ